MNYLKNIGVKDFKKTSMRQTPAMKPQFSFNNMIATLDKNN